MDPVRVPVSIHTLNISATTSLLISFYINANENKSSNILPTSQCVVLEFLKGYMWRPLLLETIILFFK